MDTVKKFISTFMIATSNCSLYSKEHTSVDESAKKCLLILSELPTDHLEIMIVDDDLIINKNPLRDAGLHGTNLIKRFKRNGISHVDFLKGVTFSEMKQFIIDIAGTDKILRTYLHIKTGVVDVHTGGLKIDADLDMGDLTHLASTQVEKVKDVYHNISPFRRLNTAGLNEIVANFIVAFRKKANILKLISPIKSHSEYTYIHATNVAVLSMSQAESLGMRDELLHNIGIAALLHDTGKLFISKDILDKKGTLNEQEWEEIQRHTLYGARYLAKIDNLPRIAPIVALEHHLRYNGQGYPKFNGNGKIQHICSQIVAISDVFDALRSRRPYREPLHTKDILALMKKNAGTDFNVFLIDNFIRILLMTQS